MMADSPDEMAGFKIPLYAMFHIKNLDHCPGFGEQEAELNLRDYGKEKIQIIVKGLNWDVRYRDVDYKSLFPSMKYSNDEILWCFEKTLREMIDMGLGEENLGGQ